MRDRCRGLDPVKTKVMQPDRINGDRFWVAAQSKSCDSSILFALFALPNVGATMRWEGIHPFGIE